MREPKQQPNQPSEEERHEITELKARDREVRAHEQAHLAAAGELALGGASFEYTTGPAGQRYAVGGEVRIDTGGVEGDPEATLEKAERIIRAALAPAAPSSQDSQVAAQARQLAAQARIELARERYAEEEVAVDEPEPGRSLDTFAD